MSPSASIAAISRWRDREVGDFEYQFKDLLVHLVSSGGIDAPTAWSMSRMLTEHDSIKLLRACLNRVETERGIKEILLDAYELNIKQGSYEHFWRNFQDMAEEYSVNLNALGLSVPPCSPNKGINKETIVSTEGELEWLAAFLDGLNVLIPSDLNVLADHIIDSVRSSRGHLSLDQIWGYVVDSVQPSKHQVFLDAVLTSEIQFYDCQKILKRALDAWGEE